MADELRLLVVVGLAVAVWLVVVPTASGEVGSSCGAPLLSMSVRSAIDDGLAPDCPARNETRVKQGVATLAGALAVLGLAATWRAVESRPPERRPRSPSNPRTYYEDG